MELRHIKGYLFDIDGVLLLGKEAIPGAKELLDALRSRGNTSCLCPIPARSRLQCIEQFTRADIQIADEELFWPAKKQVSTLRPQTQGAGVCPWCQGLYAELEKEGIEILPRKTWTPRQWILWSSAEIAP